MLHCITFFLPPLCILGSTDVRHLVLWEGVFFFCILGKLSMIMSDIDISFYDSSGNCDNWLLFT